jgi:hypothetical protein
LSAPNQWLSAVSGHHRKRSALKEVIMVPKFRLIQELAYRLWIARGCPEGSADADWHEAERQLAVNEHQEPTDKIDDSLQAMFPAGDPPSGRPTDKPRATRTRKSGQPTRGNSRPLQ